MLATFLNCLDIDTYTYFMYICMTHENPISSKHQRYHGKFQHRGAHLLLINTRNIQARISIAVICIKAPLPRLSVQFKFTS